LAKFGKIFFDIFFWFLFGFFLVSFWDIGAHVAQAQMEALSALQECDTTNQFLILFGKLSGNKFRGLYSVNKSSKDKGKICVKMYGTGPSVIEEEMCGKFYRYNSGRKEFCLLGGSKSIERTTCAVSLYPGCYNKGYGKSSGGMPDFMK
jgi:hypothetical protein